MEIRPHRPTLRDDGLGGGWHQPRLPQAPRWTSNDPYAWGYRFIECFGGHGRGLFRGGAAADGVIYRRSLFGVAIAFFIIK